MSKASSVFSSGSCDSRSRLRGRTNYRIDYRHIIDWLVRKPGAFAGYRYREHLFPSSRFRMAYDLLQATMAGRCDRRYLQILEFAAKQETGRGSGGGRSGFCSEASAASRRFRIRRCSSNF